MTLEDLKRESDHLRGSLVAELAHAAPSFGDGAAQILKFHGIYQQDDRDHRAGIDRDYVMMVRASLPGGVMSAEQYLVASELADWVGDGTLRITSRQGLQWHHVRKGSLRPLIWTLNQSLVTTFAACGDVVRNVVACPAPPEPGKVDLGQWATWIAERFRPRTEAYYEIWVDGARTVSAETPSRTDEETLYGDSYLPRKFKIGLASAGDNCVDVLTHDVGLVPVLRSDGSVEAFTILAGGGQGRSHNRPDTYPRLADPLTTVASSDVLDVLEAIVRVQRDNGDRADRKHARLKYLIDRWGVPRFRSEVEGQLGWRLPSVTRLGAMSHRDHLGWHGKGDAQWLGLHVENGRIADSGDRRVRSALATIVERYRPGIRFTAQQNVILVGFDDDERRAVNAILADHGVAHAEGLPLVVRDAMACVALPTCGLALTDAERALPDVLRDIGGVLDAVGLDREEIVVRMTGCPNGCARPYSTEIGLVGRRRNRYDVYLGGARDGTRLNDLFVEAVPTDEIASTLRPLFAAFAAERWADETFGDYIRRKGLVWLRGRYRSEQAS